MFTSMYVHNQYWICTCDNQFTRSTSIKSGKN